MKYKECGLDNVELLCGQENYVQDILRVHQTISRNILAKDYITGKELMFLRTELGLNPFKLASLCGVEEKDIRLCEQSELPIDKNKETAIRKLFKYSHGK